jgi:putative transposase
VVHGQTLATHQHEQAAIAEPPADGRQFAKAGAPTADVCRKHGVLSATFYKWKAKFGGLDVSDARRLKALEDENAKLKKLLAETVLDNAILKDINSRKW